MPLSLLLLFAALQGITEFLPVSSSGHLQLVWAWLEQRGLGGGLPPFTRLGFEIAAHFGTLVAVLIFTAPELCRIALGCGKALLARKHNEHSRLAFVLVVATVPLFAVGWFLRDLIAETTRDGGLLLVAWTNLAFALALLLADKFSLRVRRTEHLRLRDGVALGLAQAAAVVPGVSRSGVVITMARVLGCERLAAARVSLLLSIPAILGASGAAVLGGGQLGESLGALAVVAVAACAIAVPTISFLLRWVRHAGYGIFVAYRLLFGLALFAWVLWG